MVPKLYTPLPNKEKKMLWYTVETTQIKVTVLARNSEEAILKVMDIEFCPRSAILNVTLKGEMI